MNNVKLSPANIVILVAGAVMLVASFLDFFEIDFGAFGGSRGFSAWDGDLFFPVTIIPVLCGVAMALHVALSSFGNVSLPDRLVGLGWSQVHVALGLQATLMMLAFLVQDKDPFDTAFGFWLMLVAAIALLVGAVLRQREAAPAA
jgi:hypothetical protein